MHNRQEIHTALTSKLSFTYLTSNPSMGVTLPAKQAHRTNRNDKEQKVTTHNDPKPYASSVQGNTPFKPKFVLTTCDAES
jgi:hypothetical protein